MAGFALHPDDMSNTMSNSRPVSNETLNPDDPRFHYAAGVASMLDVVARLDAAALEAPTPCEAMDVRMILGHLASMLGRTAALGRGTDPFAIPEIVSDVVDDGWGEALSSAAAEVHAAWSDASKLAESYTMPWAVLTGSELLMMYVNEILVHTWDIAQGAGLDFDPAEATTEAALLGMQLGLPAEGRRESFEAVFAQMPVEERPAIMPFEDVQPTAADAPAIDRLVAWNGRRP